MAERSLIPPRWDEFWRADRQLQELLYLLLALLRSLLSQIFVTGVRTNMGAACPSFTFSWLDNIFDQLFVSLHCDAAPEVTFFNLGLRNPELIVVAADG